ncbi:MAG: hypothetical protein FWC39_06355 [Bacteroidetes bacterium]|nr:hypothetical protein [Bacteroidota bacterium]
MESILALKGIMEFVVLVIGIPIAIVQVFLLIRQMKISAQQTKEQNEWNKKEVTFKYFDLYTQELKNTNEALFERFDFLNKDKDTKDCLDSVKELLSDEKKRLDLFCVVAYFERLGLGIKKNYFDPEITKELISIVAIKTFKSLSCYFEIREKELGLKEPLAPNFKWLIEKWEREIKLPRLLQI